MLHAIRCSALMAVLLTAVATTANAASIQFTVDPNQSSLSISVDASLFLGIASEQSPGSWTTSYSGVINADVTATTIEILGTSAITAGVSGNWLPGDDYSDYDPTSGLLGADYPTVPNYETTAVAANYGTTTELYDSRVSNSAVRDVQLSLSSGVIALNTETFDEVGIVPTYLDGTVYYDEGAEPPITDLTLVTPNPFTDAVGTGTLVQNGNLLTLTIPVTFTDVSFFAITTTHSGTLVATAVIPEPVSAMLLLAGLPALTLRRRRNR